MSDYHILAFYHFAQIEDPHAEVKRHKQFLESLDARARVYISSQGINAQMSFKAGDAHRYQEWLKTDPRFEDVSFKIDVYHEHVLPKLTVKVRTELVALGSTPDPQEGGEHVSPSEWKEMLENREEDTLLIDVRNDYETKVGHFEGAECPDIHCFRDFPEYVHRLAEKHDPASTKVMMYCTGGVRCELYSVLMKEKGFKAVYQLEGGVIRYGHEVGNAHWKGSLFVFDDRLNVPIAQEGHEVISHCSFCSTKTDVYYNCANMACNALFLSCLPCAEKMQGCCCETCIGHEKRRPFEKKEKPKPFRKWYHYMSSKECKDGSS